MNRPKNPYTAGLLAQGVEIGFDIYEAELEKVRRIRNVNLASFIDGAPLANHVDLTDEAMNLVEQYKQALKDERGITLKLIGLLKMALITIENQKESVEALRNKLGSEESTVAVVEQGLDQIISACGIKMDE